MSGATWAAWVQTGTMIVLAAITGFYALQTYRLEQRESRKEVRGKRALAVPLLDKISALQENVNAWKMSRSGPPQIVMKPIELDLKKEAKELLPLAVQVDDEIVKMIRGYVEGGTPGRHIDFAVHLLYDRCHKIVFGEIDPI